MGSTLAEDQVEKKPYKNQTAGWLGVVKVDHLGAQVGHSVEPHGTVYLSDTEAILTARAPKAAADNPFEEQEFAFQDESGKRVMQMMRPLVLVTDGEGKVGEERFVPGLGDEPALDTVAHSVHLPSVAAAATDTATALAANADRHVPTEPVAATPVPALAQTAAVPGSQARPAVQAAELAGSEPLDEEPPSWVDNPDRTEQPQQGSLGGSHEPAPGGGDDDPAKTGSPTHTPPQAPVPHKPPTATSTVEETPQGETQRVVPSESAGTQTAAGSPSEQSGSQGEQASAAETEEHAGVTQTGEETGAADRPAGDAPEGEFAAHEEVGTPEAPASETAKREAAELAALAESEQS